MIHGIIPPIVTPIDEKEEVNYKELGNLIDYVIEGGVHGIFPLGSNGEFYAFDARTQGEILDFVVKHTDKRVPVYAGVTHITTKGTVELIKAAEKAGVDALSILTPMFIQPNEEEMYQHFKTIAESTDLPILLYNNPGKTTNDISVKLLKRLAEIPNVVGIKNTTLNFAQTLQYIEAVKDVENFKILSGIDYYIYGTLSHGGVGAIAGTANVAPKLVVEIYEKFKKGDLRGALATQQKLIPLRDAFGSGTFPVVAKDCLRLMGIITGSTLKPVTPCVAEKQEHLRAILKSLDLI